MPTTTEELPKQHIESDIDRVIGRIDGSDTGPIVVFFGGIHGNEPAGVKALQKLFKVLDPKAVDGTIIGFAGNVKALNTNQRFIDEDLNRIWTTDRIKKLHQNSAKKTHEEKEMRQLHDHIKWILDTKDRPVYFIDFHTTSSQTVPFITINDALINRRFSQHFPLPVVLGIEEYLNGPLLSYINTLGFVSLGFESGQHEDIAAVKNAYAFAMLTLFYTGTLKEDQDTINIFKKQLWQESDTRHTFFQITYLERLESPVGFQMNAGFKSFQAITEGEALAIKNGKHISAPENGLIFMPLYQRKGKEGFFIINRIPKIWLQLSTYMRRLKIDSFLSMLPGINWKSKSEGVLMVHLRIARFFAKDFFHLLGYRSKKIDASHLLMYNRERVAKKTIYKSLKWYNTTPDLE